MALPHPEPRQHHDGKKDEPRRGRVVGEDLKGAVDIADDRNGADQMNPAEDHAQGCLSHGDSYSVYSKATLRRAGITPAAPKPLPAWRKTASSRLRAAKSLLLVRPEAGLLHAQVRAVGGRRQREGDDALQIEGGVVVLEIPGVGQRLVRLDREHLAIQHAAPFAAQVEAVADARGKIVLHQPFLDQMRLRQRAPEFFRRMGDVALDDDGACFGCSVGHWSILFSRSSRSSNFFSQ